MSPEAHDGPSLQTYIETRFNLLQEAVKASIAAQSQIIASADATAAAARAAADLRYQQRFEAQSDALTAAFLAQQTAMQTAFSVAKEAVAAALAAQDRAVSKAELAADKRFESVNEFRKTLDDQQRTLMPRAEADVVFRGLQDKLTAMKEMVDRTLSERRGAYGGWGMAVGVVGLVATVVALISWLVAWV